jgi:acyl-CoA dehydrogenase
MTAADAGAAGVSFALSPEQRDLRALAHEFAEREIRPRAAHHDRTQTHPAEIVAAAHALGLTNLRVPARLGGPGLPVFADVLVCEELAWGCSGIAVSVTGNALGIAPLLLAGSEEQQERWLAPLVEAPLLCSFALTEPGAGSDVGAIATTAERRGGEYVLNGAKTFISNAGHAAWSTVFASTDRSRGSHGLSAFVVPMDADGITIERHLDKLGQRATDTSGFVMHDVRVPAADRLGAEGDGFRIAMRTLDVSRPATAAGAVGVARAAYEHAVAYARERVAFGVPIAEHQGVAFLIADMATEIEAARLLVWQAAASVDAGDPRATLHASFAKRFAADTAMKVATDAVQVFGGYGYMAEYPVEKLLRDAKLFQIYEGTSQIQRLVIARQVFGGAAS